MKWTAGRLAAGFICFNIVSGTAAGLLMFVIPIYAIHVGAGATEIGLLRSASGFGMLLLVLPAGDLVDRFGWKRLYLIGGSVSVLTLLAFPWLRTPGQLIAVMGVQGMANALKFSSINAAFFLYLKQMGVRRAGWHKGSMSIGLTFIGPMLGGFLLPVVADRQMFVLASVLTLLPMLFAWFGPPSPKSEASGRTQDAASTGFLSRAVRPIAEYGSMIRRPAILRTVGIESLSTACFSTFAAFVALYLSRTGGMAESSASWFLIMEGVVFILTVFLAGGLLRRYDRLGLYLVSFVLTAAGLLLFSLGVSVEALAIGTVIMGGGLGLTNLITYSQAAELPEEKGKLSGLLSFCTGIGSSAGPALCGAAGELWGLQAIFLSFLPFFLLSFVFILRERSRQSLEHDPLPNKPDFLVPTDAEQV